MSFCVSCGVELDQTAGFCALCGTAVCHPDHPRDTRTPPPFPPESEVIGPASKLEVAILLSVMLACAMTACLVLNLFLLPDRLWSMYPVGACVMLWVLVVPGLLTRKIPFLLMLFLDMASVGLYVFLISVDLNGGDWFLALALPILLLGSAVVLVLGASLGGGKRSILSTVILLIGAVGVFFFGVEFFVDQFLRQGWQPGWSIVVLVICVAFVIPLIVVRRIPRLREEARRRFHM